MSQQTGFGVDVNRTSPVAMQSPRLRSYRPRLAPRHPRRHDLHASGRPVHALPRTLATLGALRGRYPGARLWVVFEPRSATSRRAVFQDGFARSFAAADRVVLAPLWEPSKVPEGQRLDVERMVHAINAAGTRATAPGGVDQIVAEIASEAAAGDVVTILSSGAFGGIHRKLLIALGATSI